MEATRKFWKEILPFYTAYVSEKTVQELKDTRDEKLRRQFLGLIREFKVLRSNEAIRNLAGVYIAKGIFPEKYLDDALHVAIASYFEISYLVSWNEEN